MMNDSGERREFDTGAVRDIQEGKGRCDLLPLAEINYLLRNVFDIDNCDNKPMFFIEEFRITGNEENLLDAAIGFADEIYKDIYTAILELSKHFEEGAAKYGPYNWQKGIPIHSYIDSAIRHYLKHSAGWDDERHDRAFMWNLICAAWTMRNIPEMDDYTKKREAKGQWG